MTPQRTLRHSVRASGVGLHSGAPVYLRLRPAPPDSGVEFRRVDVDPPIVIRASVDAVADSRRATTLAAGGARIGTVEHFMAALAGLGIDNVRVDVSAGEMPILDGSAAPYVRLLQQAGIVAQPTPKRCVRILREIVHEEDGVRASLAPYEGRRFDYTLEYDHPFFAGRSQRCVVELSEATFERDLCRARTFGFLSEIGSLETCNLARGGSLDNAIVIGDHDIVNAGGFRLDNELARHKILDAVGDLHLLGCPVLGAFTGYRSGHATNLALLRRLLAADGAFEVVEAPAAGFASRARLAVS